MVPGGVPRVGVQVGVPGPVVHPGYTAGHTAAADVIHALTADSRCTGRTSWAQRCLLGMGRSPPRGKVAQSCHDSSKKVTGESREE